MKNNLLHKLKYRVQLNIPTYLVKLLCFISFDNSKLLVHEYSKTIDWIGGCIGTVEHQTVSLVEVGRGESRWPFIIFQFHLVRTRVYYI